MRRPFTQLYLHCVWATWDRMPLLVPAVEQPVYAAIVAKCHELGCQSLKIGGTLDHVHLLVRFPTTLAVADLVKEVKGAASPRHSRGRTWRVLQVARVVRSFYREQGSCPFDGELYRATEGAPPFGRCGAGVGTKRRRGGSGVMMLDHRQSSGRRMNSPRQEGQSRPAPTPGP